MHLKYGNSVKIVTNRYKVTPAGDIYEEGQQSYK
jgi:hypothetical protein